MMKKSRACRYSILMSALLLTIPFDNLCLAQGEYHKSTLANLGGLVHEKAQKPQLERFGDDLEYHLAKVQPLLKRYGYPAIFLAVMVEGVGLLAPGQTLLIVGAIEAAKGDLSIAWVFTCALLAAVLGNSLGYLLGRWFGRPLLGKIKVNEKRLKHTEGYFIRYGKWIVLFARFFDGLRQLNGIVAGMMKMPWRIFTFFNILGAILWTGVWGLGAYFLDKDITAMQLSFRKIQTVALALSLVGLLAFLVYLLRHRQTEATH
jgi:membrane protein DedA with SNARE-associated domain